MSKNPYAPKPTPAQKREKFISGCFAVAMVAAASSLASVWHDGASAVFSTMTATSLITGSSVAAYDKGVEAVRCVRNRALKRDNNDGFGRV